MPGFIDIMVGSQEGEGKTPRDVAVPLAAIAGGIEALVRIGHARPAAGLALGALRAGTVGGGLAGIGRPGAGGVVSSISQMARGGAAKAFGSVLAGPLALAKEATDSAALMSQIAAARKLGIDQLGIAFSAIRRGGAPLDSTGALSNIVKSYRGLLDKAFDKGGNILGALGQIITGTIPNEVLDKARTTQLFKKMFDFLGDLGVKDEKEIRRRYGYPTTRPTTQPTSRAPITPEGPSGFSAAETSLLRDMALRKKGSVPNEVARKALRGYQLSDPESEYLQSEIELSVPYKERSGFLDRRKSGEPLGAVPWNSNSDRYLDFVRKALDESEPVDEGTLANSWVWPLSNNFYS